MSGEDFNNKDKGISVYVCISIFLLVIAIFVFVFVSKSIKNIKVYENANFEKVEATITEYKEFIDWDETDNLINGKDYATFYEYRSSDGYIYSGCWEPNIRSEEEAKAQIGMKVTIYVDHELHLQKKSLDINYTGVIVGAIIGFLCLVVSLALIVYLTVYFVRLRKNGDNILKEETSEDKPPKNYCTLNCAIILLAIFVTIGFTGSSISNEKEYRNYINAQFIEVDAEIFEYKEFEKDGTVYYATYYKYVSEDRDEYYSGIWRNEIFSEQEAQAAVGSKVPLYYDKNLGVVKSKNDVRPVEKPNHLLNGIIVATAILLFINSLARIIRFIIRDKKYEKQKGKSAMNNA